MIDAHIPVSGKMTHKLILINLSIFVLQYCEGQKIDTTLILSKSPRRLKDSLHLIAICPGRSCAFKLYMTCASLASAVEISRPWKLNAYRLTQSLVERPHIKL